MFELRSILNDKTAVEASFRPRLLWAPHWSKDWLNGTQGFAQWRKTVGVILDFAYSNPLIDIVVRPHPILREVILASRFKSRLILNREALKAIDLESDSHDLDDFSNLLSLQNVSMSDNTLLEDILRSSHLVTDGVSIIGYWATTGKPMLVVEGKEGSPFNEDGILLISTSDRAINATEITSWLNNANFTSPSPINLYTQELSKKLHPTFSKSPMQIFQESIR
jgi:hypothetical protein